MTNESLQQQLTDKFGDQLTGWETPYGMLTFTMPATSNTEVVGYLKNDLGFTFMTDLTAIHYPERKNEELCIVYMLHNLQDNIRVRLKAYVPVAQPDIRTMSGLFSTANWLERETYDFLGVNFTGHPNLIRIMNVDEMDYFPLRKEYEMEDPTRRDKDDEMFGRGNWQ
jgi:NADH-quinone oxidoreductase subunit C